MDAGSIDHIARTEEHVVIVLHFHRIAQGGDFFGTEVKIELHAVIMRVFRAGDGHLVRTGDRAGGRPKGADSVFRQARLLFQRRVAAEKLHARHTVLYTLIIELTDLLHLFF